MSKELSKRKEGHVLYEPPEPLFPESMPPRRLRRMRAFLLLVLVISIAVALSFAVFGKESTEDVTESGTMPESDVTTDTVYDQGDVDSSETEGGAENIHTETDDTTETEHVPDSGVESDTEADPDSDGRTLAIDLSQIERGESYVINYSSTDADIEGLLDRGFTESESVGGAAPLILILHTHTSEKYLDSDFKGLESVVSVGEVICGALNRHGVPAVHCTVIHDGDGQNAYTNARETIELMLKVYPSIKYVLDVHRLSLYEEDVPVKSASGSADSSAQIRLTVGVNDGGSAWQESLSLSLALRKSLNKSGERICMPAVISPSLPNSDLGSYYIMVDIGSVGNTTEEAIAAGKRLGISFADVLLN